MDEPIVRTLTTYRCPRCDATFVSHEDYDAHSCRCSQELVAKAASLVGKWIVVAETGRTVVGVVRGSDGPNIVVSGFVAHHSQDTVRVFHYDRYTVHVSQTRDASNAYNAMMMLDSLTRAGIREMFEAKFPEVRRDME